MIRKPLLYCLACLVLLSPSVSAQTAKYDLFFKRWGQFYFPWQDWHWWKAQGMAESGLNPGATSSCGATGIMQLMPATAKAMGVNAHDPEGSIQGGIKYDSQLWTFWKGADDRMSLTLASYNAGPGNIQQAVKLADSGQWDAVAARLPDVTGKRAPETVAYVSRVRTLYETMERSGD